MSMNIQTPIKLTSAESALVDAFAAQFSELPGNGDVVTARDILADDIKTAGLPTRRIESWHYTDLKTMLRTLPSASAATSATKLEPLVAGVKPSYLLHGASEITATEGVTLTSYAEQLKDGSAAAGLSVAGFDDAIARINGSFVRDGISLNVPAGAQIETPIELQVVHGAGQIHTRIPARFGAGSKATVIERHLASGEGEGEAFVSSLSDITVEDGAEATWIIVQQQGAKDTHLGQLRLKIGAEAKLHIFVFAKSCALIARVKTPSSTFVASIFWAAKPTQT
jgi:Fe-S cluster assembly protein SufD